MLPLPVLSLPDAAKMATLLSITSKSAALFFVQPAILPSLHHPLLIAPEMKPPITLCVDSHPLDCLTLRPKLRFGGVIPTLLALQSRGCVLLPPTEDGHSSSPSKKHTKHHIKRLYRFGFKELATTQASKMLAPLWEPEGDGDVPSPLQCRWLLSVCSVVKKPFTLKPSYPQIL